MARRHKVSLNELMGSGTKGEDLKLSRLHEILGDAMPELPRNAVGRHRLVRALQQRFGRNFRSLPGVSGLVKEFDHETKFEQKLGQIRGIRYKPTKES
jgi:hypothetical protein